MAVVFVVLNAGSSSRRISAFLADDPLRLLLRCQLEGIETHTRGKVVLEVSA
jgi:hypothetical protein